MQVATAKPAMSVPATARPGMSLQPTPCRSPISFRPRRLRRLNTTNRTLTPVRVSQNCAWFAPVFLSLDWPLAHEASMLRLLHRSVLARRQAEFRLRPPRAAIHGPGRRQPRDGSRQQSPSRADCTGLGPSNPTQDAFATPARPQPRPAAGTFGSRHWVRAIRIGPRSLSKLPPSGAAADGRCEASTGDG